MLHSFQVKYPDKDISNVYMLASTVSSKILASMAKKEGFNFEVNFLFYYKFNSKIVKLYFNN